MASLFNKINRLKQQPEWSWSHFELEAASIHPDSIKLKVLQSFHRSPHKKPTPLLVGIIDQLHSECFPSPFPESLDRLMRVYSELKRSKREITRDKNSRDLEAHAKRLLSEVAEGDYLSEACLQWLLGNIEFDRIAPALDSKGLDAALMVKACALGHYQGVVTALEAHNKHHPESPVGMRHRYRIDHNMLTCYLSAYPSDNHEQDAATLQYLRNSDYLGQCKKALADEPFQWAIARNGLRFSSLLGDADEVDCFFSLLLQVSPRFLDLSYEPYNQLAISVMPDYHWAIRNVLTPAYLREQERALKQKANRRQQAA